MSTARLILTLSGVLLAPCYTSAVQESPEFPPLVYCEGDWAPAEIKSNPLVSPDGKYEVFVRLVSRKIGQMTTDLPACSAVAEVYVKRLSRQESSLVLRDEGGPKDPNFRSILAVDWSPNSRQLLLWVRYGWYHTDNTWDIIRLYSVNGATADVDYVKAMRRFYEKECDGAAARVLGFSPQGEVVFEIWQTGLDEASDDPCGQDRFGLWAVNPTTLAARRLPADYKVQRYGKVEEQESRK